MGGRRWRGGRRLRCAVAVGARWAQVGSNSWPHLQTRRGANAVSSGQCGAWLVLAWSHLSGSVCFLFGTFFQIFYIVFFFPRQSCHITHQSSHIASHITRPGFLGWPWLGSPWISLARLAGTINDRCSALALPMAASGAVAWSRQREAGRPTPIEILPSSVISRPMHNARRG